MKLFLVSRPDAADWDEYDSFVVVAGNEQEARFTHPSGDERWDPDVDEWRRGETTWERSFAWPIAPSVLTVEEIGEASPDRKPGVILASFNAG